jgi:hypothetical protein
MPLVRMFFIVIVVSSCIVFLWVIFQLGDGTLIALWSAVFANTSETNNMWEICADQILSAGRLIM